MLIDYLTHNYIFAYFFYLLFDCVISSKYKRVLKLTLEKIYSVFFS
jgi:hypothetical protein